MHHQINYVELHASNLADNKHFFSKVFNWKFTDYGEDYSAFDGSGIQGGFFTSKLTSDATQGSALVVIFSDNLEDSLEAVKANGGEIKQDIFSFPGGRRFHFLDPSKNEWAVWGE